jgi:hypothetical protein
MATSVFKFKLNVFVVGGVSGTTTTGPGLAYPDRSSIALAVSDLSDLIVHIMKKRMPMYNITAMPDFRKPFSSHIPVLAPFFLS